MGQVTFYSGIIEAVYIKITMEARITMSYIQLVKITLTFLMEIRGVKIIDLTILRSVMCPWQVSFDNGTI